jgi:hypothetical protein
MAGGAVLAMLMGCLEQYFARKQRGPRAM